MKCNVGKVERIIRAFLGLGILGAGLVSQSPWGLVGAIPIVTAALGWCPLYVPFGISTCKSDA